MPLKKHILIDCYFLMVYLQSFKVGLLRVIIMFIDFIAEHAVYGEHIEIHDFRYMSQVYLS